MQRCSLDLAQVQTGLISLRFINSILGIWIAMEMRLHLVGLSSSPMQPPSSSPNKSLPTARTTDLHLQKCCIYVHSVNSKINKFKNLNIVFWYLRCAKTCFFQIQSIILNRTCFRIYLILENIYKITKKN